MGFSDRILGKKNVNGGPRIDTVAPSLALAGGELRITGSGLRPHELHRPKHSSAKSGIMVVSSGRVTGGARSGRRSGPVVVAATMGTSAMLTR